MASVVWGFAYLLSWQGNLLAPDDRTGISFFVQALSKSCTMFTLYLLIIFLVKIPAMVVHLHRQPALQYEYFLLMVLPEFLVHLQLVSHLVTLPVVLLVLPGNQVLRADGSKSVILLTTMLQLKRKGRNFTVPPTCTAASTRASSA